MGVNYFRFLLFILLPLSALGQPKGSVVTIGESADVDKLNPYTNFSATGSYINEYIYFSLLRTDKASHHFVPLIALDLPEVSSDQLEYTYTIDPAAKWTHGKQITSRDVIFSMQMIKNPFCRNDHKHGHYGNIVDVYDSGNNTVTIRLARATPQALRITGEFALLSSHYFDPGNHLASIPFEILGHPGRLTHNQLDALKKVGEKVNVFGSDEKTFHAHAACGPYVLEKWEPGKEIVLVYNKKFWGRNLEQPKNNFFLQNVERLRFVVVGGEVHDVRSHVVNSSLDCISALPPELFLELSSIPELMENFHFHTPMGPSYDYIGFNMHGGNTGRKPFFENVLVRKAVAHLIDVDHLMQAAQYGLGNRISSDFPAFRPEFENSDLELIDYSPDLSKSLLVAAGWIDSNGNGIRDKVIDGERLEFEVEIMYNENKPYRKKIADYVKETLAQAGIRVKVKSATWKEYLDHLANRDFDMMVGAWVSDPNEDSYHQVWHTGNWENGSNWAGFGDESTDALIDAYDHETNPEVRKLLSLKIQAAIYQDQPYIFLWRNTQSIVINKKFQNAPTYPVRPGFWASEWKLKLD